MSTESGHPAVRSIDAMNRGDLEAAKALHAPDLTLIEMPFGDEGWRGPEGKEASSARWREAMPDGARNQVEHVIESGDWVVMEGVLKGRHTGPLRLPERTIAPTGKEIEIRYCTVSQAVDGQIVLVKHYYDTWRLRNLDRGVEASPTPQQRANPSHRAEAREHEND